MNMRRLHLLLAALPTSLLGTACAPVPMLLYVPDATQGKTVYSACAINKNVPDSLELDLQGLHAQIKLVQTYSRGYLEVRLDVPQGMTVQLNDGIVKVDREDGRPPLEARYPNISLVDTPSINSFSGSSALAKYMVPVRTSLVGARMVIGKQAWNKHYWMAARIDTEGARDVTVTLPGFTINGAPTSFPALRFNRDLYIVLAPFNC